MSHPLYDIIRLLEDKNVHFSIAWDGRDTITIFATLVGKRVEIYVDDYGNVDFSVFRGNEDVMSGRTALTSELDAD